MSNIRSFKHLSAIERGKIEVLLSQKVSIAEIARRLNRHYNTIYHEIRKKKINQIKQDKDVQIYYADTAQLIYEKNRENSKNKIKLLKNFEFIKLLETLFFEKKWSIEVCIAYIKINYKNIKTLALRTVYNYIDKGLLKIKNIDLQEKVTRRRTHKRKQRENKKKYGESIDNRSTEINERLEYGHFEGDTIRGKKGKNESCLLTLVDRKSRYMIIRKVENGTSAAVSKAILEVVKEMPVMFKSITFDNGSEFSTISEDIKQENIDISIYFAHPYSSWERGTNERHNRLVRRFIKKGKSINPHSEESIQYIQDWINDLPRKMFNWQTPTQQIEKLFSS